MEMKTTAINAELAQLDGYQMRTEPTAIDQNQHAHALNDLTKPTGGVYHAQQVKSVHLLEDQEID